MRGVCLILVVANFAISFQFKLGKRLTVSHCAGQNHIRLHEIFKDWSEDTLPDTKNVKCFVKCSFIAFNYMTRDGKLLLDNIAKDTSEKTAQDCGQKATSQGGEDPCSVAYYYKRCLYAAGNINE